MTRHTTANAVLLLTAVIWGFAFVAQRVGMDHLGPFTFNGIRFLLGAGSLVPLIWWQRRRGGSGGGANLRTLLTAGLQAGALLFLGASMQQIGLLTTTAGNAGFLTGLYVILVPIMGLFWGQRTGRGTWTGAVMAVAGMWLLSVSGDFQVVTGDVWVAASALCWAGHVLAIGALAPRVDALVLSCLQFVVCGALSLLWGLVAESPTLAGVRGAAMPILYGGLMSVGVAYTLQTVGQQWARPSHAAIILSLEGVFAAVGGWLLLAEALSMRQLSGCGLMLAGMLASQLWVSLPKREGCGIE